MCINLQPIIGQSTSNCFFFTLSTLLKYYKKDTYFHNACLWDFKFDYNPGLRLNDGLFEDELYTQYYRFIFQTTGLSLNIMKTESYKQTIVKSLMQNKPVLLHYDSYYCPWSYNYLKYHYDHFFIIIGYDNGNYTCVDSFFLDEADTLSEKLFDQGAMHIIDHQYKNSATNVDNIISLVKDSLQINTKMLEKSKMFQDMLLMAECILYFNKAKEFEGHKDVKTVPLFTKVQNIVLNRNALSNVCQQLFNETGQTGLKEISELFVEANQEWNMLLVLLMKFFVTGMDKPRMNSSKQLKNIVTLEVQIAKKLNYLLIEGDK